MKFEIDHKSPVPLHAQVEQLLRELIAQEEYQKGKTLPSEVELSKRLAISRSTVRQAVKKLVFEGLLVRKKKAGTRVAPQPVSSRSNNWLSFSQEMKVRGIPIRNFELHLSWVKPPSNVVDFFNIPEDKKVLKMERVRGKPDEPFVYFVSYFHPRIGLTGEEDFKMPLYEMLEQEHSTIASLSKEEISATASNELVSQKLEIEIGTPVLFRKRFVFDQGERPIEFNFGYYKSDSFIYSVESSRQGIVKFLILSSITKHFPNYKSNFLLKQHDLNKINYYVCTQVHYNLFIDLMIQNEEKSKSTLGIKRKTDQYILPPTQVSSLHQDGQYDIYPRHHMESGKIFEGYEGLVDFIIKHKTVCFDGFSGVAWEIVAHKICDAVKSKGFTVNAIAIEKCLKDENEIASMVAPFLGEEESVWGRKCDFSLLDYFDKEKLKTVKPNDQSVINIVYGSGASLVDWDCPLVYFDLPKNELQYRMRAGSVTNLGISTSNVDFKMYKHYYFIDWVVLNQEKERLASKIDVIVDAQFSGTITWSHMNDIKEALKVLATSVFRVRPWFEPGAWGGEWMKEHISGLNKDVVNYAWAFSLIVPENGLLFESDGNLLESSFDFLMDQESKNVLGKHEPTFGTEFPIRFNFLDTYEGGNLSIQCHPSLTYIQEEFGENITQDECYYILDCKEDASVYLGFQNDIDPEAFKADLIRSQDENVELDIVDYVQKHPSKKHELYLIPNGTVHSAGSGNMVLEISATPYIFTFKMYDWLRLDLNGKPRPINIEHAFKNLNFDRKGENVPKELFSKTYVAEETSDYSITNYPTHPDHFYDVRRLEFDAIIERSTENSCQVMMLVEGDRIQLETENGHVETLAYAETFVVPAAAKSFKLKNLGQGRAKVINAFLK